MIFQEKQTKRCIRNDIILTVCILSVAAALAVYLFFFRAKGDTVKVTVDGKLYATFSLAQNITEDVCTGENNEFHNLLIIQDGKAFIQSATCPDGICVSHAPVFRDGESIVCLPQKVVVTVVSESDENADVVV